MTVIVNLLLWVLARSSSPYPAFLLGMLVAGAGAGLLNSETTKVMQSEVAAQRAGMASGTELVVRQHQAALLGALNIYPTISQNRLQNRSQKPIMEKGTEEQALPSPFEPSSGMWRVRFCWRLAYGEVLNWADNSVTHSVRSHRINLEVIGRAFS